MPKTLKAGRRNSASDLELGRLAKARLNEALAALNDMGIFDPEPDGDEMTAPAKSLSYAKRLHLPYDDEKLDELVAVKSVATDTIRGYSMLWGDPNSVDVEGEFFTKSTNFWDTELGKSPRPLTWDHAQEPNTQKAPVIGQIVEFGDDDIGRWYVAQLDRNHKYRKAIDQLIARGAVGTSSDSAPQYVLREKSAKGAVWLKQWPWFASALTTTPAEPRMFEAGALYWKSLGLTLPVLPDGGAGDAVDAARVEALKRHEAILSRYME